MIVSIDKEEYERPRDFYNLFYSTAKSLDNIYYIYGTNHIQGFIKDDPDFIIQQFVKVHKKFFYSWGRRCYVIRGEFTFEEITSDNLKIFADKLLKKFHKYQGLYTILEKENKRHFTLIVNNYSFDSKYQDRNKLCYKFGTTEIERGIYSLLLSLKNNTD